MLVGDITKLANKQVESNNLQDKNMGFYNLSASN